MGEAEYEGDSDEYDAAQWKKDQAEDEIDYVLQPQLDIVQPLVHGMEKTLRKTTNERNEMRNFIKKIDKVKSETRKREKRIKDVRNVENYGVQV